MQDHVPGSSAPEPAAGTWEVQPRRFRPVRYTFGALIAVQAVHSIEEYRGRLYDVFAPARAVSSLVSSDRQLGFLIVNIALVSFGIWCALWPVRRQWPSAQPLPWLWIAIEVMNGIGHPAWSLLQRAYTPGVATAPLLLVLACALAFQLRSSPADE